MASTTPDRSTTDRNADGRLRIDHGAFAAMAAAATPVGVARFTRWFACLATAGREE